MGSCNKTAVRAGADAVQEKWTDEADIWTKSLKSPPLPSTKQDKALSLSCRGSTLTSPISHLPLKGQDQFQEGVSASIKCENIARCQGQSGKARGRRRRMKGRKVLLGKVRTSSA